MSNFSDSGVSVSSPLNHEGKEGDQTSETNNVDLAANVQANGGVPETTKVPPDDQQSQTQIDAPLDAQNQASTESDDALTAPPPTEDREAVKKDKVPKVRALDDDKFSDDDSVDEFDERHRFQFHDFEQRVKLAPKRRKQYNQYINILEERIAMLEERCDVLDEAKKKKVVDVIAPAQDDDVVIKVPEPPKMEFGLNFQFWSSFSKEDTSHLIDVLVGEPEIGDVKKPKRRTTWVRFGANGQLPTTGEIFNDYAPVQTTATNELDLQNEVQKLRQTSIPERIRINSSALLILLHKVLGIPCTSPPNVVLRPFKAFFHNERQMRHTMKETLSALDEILTKRRQDETKTKGDDSEDGKPEAEKAESKEENNENDQKRVKVEAPSEKAQHSEEEKPTDSISADEWATVLQDLDLFHCSSCASLMNDGWPTVSDVKKSFDAIYDLLDNVIKPLNTKLRSNTAEKVRFHDLWHLFYTGDEIMVHENPRNEEDNIAGKVALKVLTTSGGRRVMKTSAAPNPYEPTYDSYGLRSHASPVATSTSEDNIAPVDGVNPFCIHAYYLDFDGSKLVPVRRRFVIAPYSGERKISNLVVYPIHYAAENEMKRDALAARGQKFIKFANPQNVTYLDCTGLELRTKEELNDKVIVDMKEYFRTEKHRLNMPTFSEPEDVDHSEISDCPITDCTYGPTCHHRTVNVVPDQQVETTVMQEYRATRPEFKSLISPNGTYSSWSPEWSICHYRLFAYKLRSREWVAVDVDNLEQPKASEIDMGFKQLVLPNDHKDILESQVREHFRKRGAQATNIAAEDDMDLVRGKGQGLILLLHGAPGVGKTATAECIADLVQKPLYPITCGDLGSTAEAVEENLKKHFTLASKWDCVMLLDEADVFLAKRRQADLQRNSIVSVFLRMLEYYKGLLFLTTNRVGTFDEAFKSRVHISLFYPNFDRKTTMRVWKTFIKQTKTALQRNDRTGIRIDEEGILDFATDHWEENPDARWNGRQIRNAFHTAVAMAEFKARGGNLANGVYDQERNVRIKVGRSQFEKIANTVNEFDDYMRKTMGTSYEARAAKEKTRARSSGARKSKRQPRDEDEEDSHTEETEEEEVSAKSKKSKKKPRKQKEELSASEDDEVVSKRGRELRKKSTKKYESSSDEGEEVSTKGKSKKKHDKSSDEVEEKVTKGKEASKKSKKQSRKKDEVSDEDNDDDAR